MKRIIPLLLFIPSLAFAEYLPIFDANSNIIRIFIEDTSKTSTDASIGLTGLTEATSSFELHHVCDSEATVIDYTVAASNVETIATIGTYAAPTASKIRFKAVDGTDYPGVYEVQIADARHSVASSKHCILSWKGGTNVRTGYKEYPLLAATPDVNIVSSSVSLGSGRKGQN